MSLVQAIGDNNGGGGTSSKTFTFPGATTSGNFLGLAVHVGVGVTSVQDNLSNNWTAGGQNGVGGLKFYFVPNSASVSSVTITCVGNTVITGIAFEWSGIVTVSPEDQAVYAFDGTVTSWATGTSAATAQANELGVSLLFGGSSAYSSLTSVGGSLCSGTSISSGYHNNVTNGEGIGLVFNTYSSIGTYQATGTCSSNSVTTILELLKLTSGGAPTAYPMSSDLYF